MFVVVCDGCSPSSISRQKRQRQRQRTIRSDLRLSTDKIILMSMYSCTCLYVCLYDQREPAKKELAFVSIESPSSRKKLRRGLIRSIYHPKRRHNLTLAKNYASTRHLNFADNYCDNITSKRNDVRHLCCYYRRYGYSYKNNSYLRISEYFQTFIDKHTVFTKGHTRFGFALLISQAAVTNTASNLPINTRQCHHSSVL